MVRNNVVANTGELSIFKRLTRDVMSPECEMSGGGHVMSPYLDRVA